jgi:hypothetical protein
MLKRISMLFTLVAAFALVAFAGTAAADPGPTPSGLTGAANMVNPNALAGMMNAMSRNNPNGNAGMWCAVFITNGVVAPGSCP